MATTSDFKPKSTYSFSTYNPTYLGVFESVVVNSIGDVETASLFSDVIAKHIIMLPHLPAGSERDPEKIDYVIVTDSTGTKHAVGLPWIIGTTIQLVERNRIVAEFEDVGPDDIERISQVLNARGYGGKFKLQLLTGN